MRTTVKDEWNMACPACGKDDRLSLTASIWVDLYPDGTLQSELNGNHEWDSSSACACGHCGWSGTVGDAHLDGPATADQELNAAGSSRASGAALVHLRTYGELTMKVTWKGPDGVGYLYATVFTDVLDQCYRLNVQLAQTDSFWASGAGIPTAKASAHPTMYTAIVNGDPIGYFDTAHEAMIAVENHISRPVNDVLDDFNYVGSRHHY